MLRRSRITAHGSRITALALLAAVALAAAPIDLNLPPPEVVEPTGPPLTIAHLLGTDEVPLSASGFEDLREFLSEDRALRTAMRDAGLGSIEIRGTDSHGDLIQRMDATEFDVVFAPALVFVRQHGDYEVLAQIGGPSTMGRGEGLGLMQTSVIFVNRTHPLFGQPTQGSWSSPEAQASAAEALSSRPIALVSASSAVGYVYPLLALRREFGPSVAPPRVFRGSSEEVVMAVLNNLHSIGACDQATLERVMRECAPGVNPNELIDEILPSSPLPAAPVVVRSELHPLHGQPLGLALHLALRTFFDTREVPPLRLETADNRMFNGLRESVAEFYGDQEGP